MNNDTIDPKATLSFKDAVRMVRKILEQKQADLQLKQALRISGK